ncbi:hypothetical protein AGABI2DRAFT_123432 [Agaricus bisporus var. bisporus H97]|uniref:hypothetical protein n=1 Tax=Agaricus bisporus var. bisporus (strain H97 / ATCC MYA-4626 / FGSC 10389) TaxID=936046 RepID=UPI00029F6871|nr:hypothetical protein AGABI2DRAFT_123432 [Agaricus bisporus var. bisporus H97]EKV41715.1 hypothetical protein AGABI2DRAFT_123432 [Agaricus bisporus var. bisporus H97]
MDVDGGSIQAVKSLRSKFEQLAVDVRRPTTPSESLNSKSVDVYATQDRLRTSLSSSGLKVGTKRPPPPPPRITKPPPSPLPSRTPSPLLKGLNGSPVECETPQGVAALKSKFDPPSRAAPHLECPRPLLPPRPGRNGDGNLLSVSPNSTGSVSPVNSRPTTPNAHHRLPPPPPVSKSRLPAESKSPQNQNHSKSSIKPAVPPRPPKSTELPPPSLLDDSRPLVHSPEAISPSLETWSAPSSLRSSRKPQLESPNLIDLVSFEPENHQQNSPPAKPFRSAMPPPPRHHTTVLPNPSNGDVSSSTSPLKLQPRLPIRRPTALIGEEPVSPSAYDNSDVTTPPTPPRPHERSPPSSSSDRKPIGNSKLPPPPTRTISLGDKLPPPRRPSPAESDDESGAEEDDPKALAVDNMPDMSASYRSLPVLRFREGLSDPKIHVHPHSGTFAVSGSYVITGYGSQIKIFDLAIADVPLLGLDMKESGFGLKELKVTAMTFRPSVHEAYRGVFLWIGTKEGHLFEMDIHAGQIIAAKHVAHPHSITHIFRYGQSMVTMDECGKMLVFSPSEDGQDISLQHTQPRVVRTTEKQEFVKLIDGKLWTASRTESHGHQKIPVIRIYDLFTPGAAGGRSLLPSERVGAVTSATILPSQPDYVYVGHEEGYISIWALRTDDGYPKCIEAIRVAMSDVLCLEGVNDRLWAGARNGLISVYDVSQKPWVVTNSWNAHPGLPVLKLGVNCCAIEKNRELCVVSVGRDECLKLWDGLLGAAWIDNELQKRESEFSAFRDVSMLLVSWNCDSARPDSLVSDPINYEFLNDTLSSVDSPDIITFGFQEVIDLENRKMTAKNVLLGGKKKSEDNGLSDKVTGAYKRWYDRLSAAVRTSMSSSCPYVCVHTENLIGLFTCTFVKHSERQRLKDIAVTTVKRGMGGRYGNKGAIVARFVIEDSSICIINCHLAAGQNAVRRRNADAAGILEEKAVFPVGDHPLAYIGGGDGTTVLDHEIVFFHGDLNYRLDHRREAIIAAVRANDLSALYQHDQLLREIKYNRGCRLRGFSEGPLLFAPTYKYDLRSDEYDTSEKHRAPSWCDRILWRSRVGSRVRLREYRRYEVDVSDHRPISGSFDLMVKVVDWSARDRMKREIEELWVSVQKDLLESARQFYVSQMLL